MDSSPAILSSTTNIWHSDDVHDWRSKHAEMEKTHLAYISYFKHLLVVQGLLRLNDARQVNKLRLVRVVANVEHGSSRV